MSFAVTFARASTLRGGIFVPAHRFTLDAFNNPVAPADLIIPEGAKYQYVEGEGWSVGYPDAEAIPKAPVGAEGWDEAGPLDDKETKELFDVFWNAEGIPKADIFTIPNENTVQNFVAKYATPETYVKSIYYAVDTVQMVYFAGAVVKPTEDAVNGLVGSVLDIMAPLHNSIRSLVKMNKELTLK